MSLHVLSTCTHHQEVKIVLHSLWYHHTCRCNDDVGVFYNKLISCLYMFRARAHHQEFKIALHSLWYHHTYRCNDDVGVFYNKFISCLYVFRAHVLIIRRSKLHYTACGIITPIGVMMM